MPSADEVIAAVETAKSSMVTARAEFLSAKSQAEELAAALAAAGAEGTASHASEAANSIEQAESATGGAVTLADEAIAHLMAVKGNLLKLTGSASPRTQGGQPGANPGDSVAAPRRVPVVEPGKFQYLLGFVTSGEHNTKRSGGMQKQFARLGIYTNPEGRQHLQDHFDDLVNRDDNVMRTYTDEYGTFEIRDSLFAGPCGFLHFESAWEIKGTERRLTTVIPKGGKRQ